MPGEHVTSGAGTVGWSAVQTLCWCVKRALQQFSSELLWHCQTQCGQFWKKNNISAAEKEILFVLFSSFFKSGDQVGEGYIKDAFQYSL